MAQPLSIVMVTNNYKPYAGGVVSSIDSFTHQLKKMGHSVTIITLDFVGDGVQEEGVIRVPCFARFKYKKNHMAIPWRTTHYVRTIIKKLKPDVIHVHHPFLLGVAGLRAARYLGIPIVFTYHTLYEAYAHYGVVPQQLTRWGLTKMVTKFCKSVDALIVPSSTVKTLVQERGVTTPVIQLPSGLLPLFCPDHLVVRQRQPATRFKLLTVSRFAKEKNIPFLLDAFALLDQKQFELTLIGYGHELTALQDYAYDHLKLARDSVRFMVKPPKAVIAQEYKRADCFIFASTTETQGLVVAEAMASGLPVIARRGPGVVDAVEQGDNGFLIESISEMASTINQVASDAQLHTRLQEGAYQTGYRYWPEQVTAQLVEVYRGLAG